MAIAEAKRGAMRGADEQSVVDQEFAWRVLQTPARMRTFVMVGGNAGSGAHQDQVESTGARIHVHVDGTAIDDVIKPT